jgi:hypothetical protein
LFKEAGGRNIGIGVERREEERGGSLWEGEVIFSPPLLVYVRF